MRPESLTTFYSIPNINGSTWVNMIRMKFCCSRLLIRNGGMELLEVQYSIRSSHTVTILTVCIQQFAHMQLSMTPQRRSMLGQERVLSFSILWSTRKGQRKEKNPAKKMLVLPTDPVSFCWLRIASAVRNTRYCTWAIARMKLEMHWISKTKKALFHIWVLMSLPCILLS